MFTLPAPLVIYCYFEGHTPPFEALIVRLRCREATATDVVIRGQPLVLVALLPPFSLFTTPAYAIAIFDAMFLLFRFQVAPPSYYAGHASHAIRRHIDTPTYAEYAACQSI